MDMDVADVFGAIEAILFVSGEPVSIVDLRRVFNMSQAEIMGCLSKLESHMAHQRRGTMLFITTDTVQLVTNPEYNSYLVKLLSPPEERSLSDSMMETLSIIAYKQPVTRSDIEAIRGVRCEYSVSQLLKQGFICELGRKDVVGRPMLFGTTDAFLRRFGLHSLSELPALPDSNEQSSGTVMHTEASHSLNTLASGEQEETAQNG